MSFKGKHTVDEKITGAEFKDQFVKQQIIPQVVNEDILNNFSDDKTP